MLDILLLLEVVTLLPSFAYSVDLIAVRSSSTLRTRALMSDSLLWISVFMLPKEAMSSGICFMYSFVSFVLSNSVPTFSNRYRISVSMDLSAIIGVSAIIATGVSGIVADALSAGPFSEELAKVTGASGVAIAVAVTGGVTVT